MLRAAIARRFTARGLPTTADQVLVTAGGQAAISLVLAALVTPGDRVLVEHPTYPNALDAVHARGARCVPVPLDLDSPGADAWDLDLVTAAVRDAAPRLAYLVPDHQNPTGALLDGAGRERLVALARRTGTPLLIDETLAELTFVGPGEAPVATHGAPDSPLVITVGSAAKVLWGGLRIGWIRTAAPMIRRLAALRAATDLGGPVLEQLVATRLIDDLEPRRAGAAGRARRGPQPPARPARRGVPELAAVAPVGWPEPVGRPGRPGVEPAGRRGAAPRRAARGRPTVRVRRRVRALPAHALLAAPRPRRARPGPAPHGLAHPGRGHPETEPTAVA